MRQVLILAFVPLILGLPAAAEEKVPTFAPVPKNFKWPPLPKSGFVRGRPATQDDINKKHAVFAAADKKAGVSLGKPMDMEIPQFAYILLAGQKRPAIIIQAEIVANEKMIGAIDLHENTHYAGLLDGFELLGTSPPAK